MRACFTINCMRKDEDFLGYGKLLNEGYYQAVELFFPYNVSEVQKESYTKNVTELLNTYHPEVVLHLPHGGINNLVGENGPMIMQRMKDAMDYANKFGAKKLTLHLGEAFKDWSREKLIDEIIIKLKELCQYANQHGMYVMVENMPGDNEIGSSVDELKYIFTKANESNLKFILDTGHAHVYNGNVSKYIYEFKDLLYHMHFSDNNGLSDQHKPINTGTIDFDKVFNALADIKYKELHCMEILFNTYKDLIDYVNEANKYDKYYQNNK